MLIGLLLGTTVVAHWTAPGTGSGTGNVATLASSSLSGVAGPGTATLNWTAVTPPGTGSVSYYVLRDGANPSGNCPTQSSPALVLTCTDTGLSKGTYSYTVTAVWHSWTSLSPATNVTLVSGGLDHFGMIAATNTPTAGHADVITISALDSAGNTLTDYSGVLCLTFSGPPASPNGRQPGYPAKGSCNSGESEVTFSGGFAAAPVTLYSAGPNTLHVHDRNGHGDSGGLALTVQPDTLNSYSIPTPGTQTAGSPFGISITALDTYGNTATGYAGVKCLVFSGPLPSPDGTAPKYPGDGGSCSSGRSAVNFSSGFANPVSITLYNPASTVLTATEPSSSATGSTGSFMVVAGALSKFVLTTPAGATAGVPFSVTIRATDSWGSTITSYTGLKCVTFSGLANAPRGDAPSYPAAGSCTGASAVTFGSGTATVSIIPYAAENSTHVHAAEGTLAGDTGNFAVAAAAATSFDMTAETTTPEAGAADKLTIRALDTYRNVATGYTGAHTLRFAGASSVPNSPYHPSVSDNGGTDRTFGTDTTVTFANGVASSNPAMKLYQGGGPFLIVVSEGSINNGTGLSVTVQVKAKMVSTGSYHTCAVLTYGGVECWGLNTYGQLGDGSTTQRTAPVAVNVADVKTVAAGMWHTCATLNNGTVYCWGRNNYGQLGDGSTTQRNAPVQVSGLTTATDVSTGQYHTCATRSGGTVVCWGRNNYGQLGDGTTTQRTTPVAVSGLTTASQVSTGMSHSCATTSAGTVMCWGRNNYGQLGDNSTTTRLTPAAAGTIANATQVHAGLYQTCARLADSTLMCWGRNNYGQLGDGSTTDRHAPVAVSGITTATQVSTGMYHSCARLSNGVAMCWGWNAQGQVGDNTVTQRNTPVVVSGLTTASQVDAGGGNTYNIEHSAAVSADGSVVCWGANNYGELGNGTTTSSRVPVVASLQ